MATDVQDPFDLGLRTRMIRSQAAHTLVERPTYHRPGHLPPVELWREMRRLLDPVYWGAWEAAPGSDQVFRQSVRSAYSTLARRLDALAWSASGEHIMMSVAQAALWWCAYPEWEEFGIGFTRPQARVLLSHVLAWNDVDPSGHGWLPAAAGLTPDEYRDARIARTLPDREALLGLATLRGHRLPHPDQVPVVRSEHTADAA